MVSKIRILPDAVINQIAAGEVIANPASVVKELVENAIDANATEITIEIKAGGRSLIRISDNGCGMNKDDALLCLERYGTSKLRHFDDLQSLKSMGFRGEAVPSIASISKLTLITALHDSQDGTMVVVEGGKLLNCFSIIRSPGTTFEVKSLFYNVPVRKKFLKSPSHDSAEILKVTSLLALANPKVGFILIEDQKEILNSKAINEDSFDAKVKDIFGIDFLENLISINHQEGAYHLQGKIGLPTFHRQNRSGQYLFINGRAVISPFISQAVKDGYGTAIPSQRHPVFLLYLQMEPALVDVNVHPQKKEVRLSEEAVIRDFIVQVTMKALQNTVQPPFFSENAFTVPFETPERFPEKFHLDSNVTLESYRSKYSEKVDWILPDPLPEEKNVEKTLFPPQPHPTTYRVVATIPGYIFAEKGEGTIYLVDQKRAHQKVLFENFKKQIDSKESAITMHQLLVPYTLEVNKSEASTLKQWLPLLNAIGISVREFGDNTFLVDSIPDAFKHQDVARLLAEILDDLQEFQLSQSVQNVQDKYLSQLSSRLSLSAQTRLSFYEAQSLLDQLIACAVFDLSPQGKPILMQIHRDSIAKIFN